MSRSREVGRVPAMTGLFFLIVCTVGILRPIRNALALDGLADTQFYKVYFLGAVVVLFVPPYNWLADRVSWRTLIPSVAVFFALNLVLFRLFYREGSTAFGMIFYAWYDLYAAALVTQFFIATQLYFNVRDAKRAYPLVIVGGSVGAALGGVITGFFAQRVGTPNLLLVAAAVITAFAFLVPLVWKEDAEESLRLPGRETAGLSVGEFRKVFANPQVRLIAVIVLLTVLVKQFVDYAYNEAVAASQNDRDAIASFQGWVFAIKDWLPVFVLVSLRPLLKRWGVGAAVFMLPVVMLIATTGIAIWWTLWMATAAKIADSCFRYSAERTGRELLYVPVPAEIKLKAKAYIDIAVEKGLAKVLSALLIGGLVMVMDYRRIAFFAAGLSVLWLAVAVVTRREYVRTLASSIQGRFASLHGLFTSLTDANTIPVLQSALTGGDAVQTAFVLDLLHQGGSGDVAPFADGLHQLLDHPSQKLRRRALEVLADSPEIAHRSMIEALLRDPEAEVREASVRALCRIAEDERQAVAELLESTDARVRLAVLACLARGELTTEGGGAISAGYLEERRAASEAGDGQARLELAVATGIPTEQTHADDLVEGLLADRDPLVASAALRGAGRMRRTTLYSSMVGALKNPATRDAAREGLAAQGPAVVETLSAHLLDPAVDVSVRRNIPSVLARIPAQPTVEALLQCYLAPETDQLLDYRTLKALNKLRNLDPDLLFDSETVLEALQREVDAARRYAAASTALRALGGDPPALVLLLRALGEAGARRREEAFRCLGLLYAPDPVYKCYLAVAGGNARTRANAIEWLEQVLHHAVFSRIDPIVSDTPVLDVVLAAPRALDALAQDNDTWVALCASAAARDLGQRGAVDGSPLPEPGPGVGTRAMPGRVDERTMGRDSGGEMELIEKVFSLQQVDLLRDARSAHLALLASIAAEIEVEPGTVLMTRDEPSEAMYLVVRGVVELRAADGQIIDAGPGKAFGTWALIDAEPSLVEARAAESTRLLRILRRDFQDLLADHVELAIELLQGLARRMRGLTASRRGSDFD